MVVRTMCLECEAVTEKAQAVCELCVPVTEDETDDEPFRAACLSTEYLRDQNKVLFYALKVSLYQPLDLHPIVSCDLYCLSILWMDFLRCPRFIT